MSKLLYITEKQLNEIIGNGAYLNNQDTTNEYRLGGSEIAANGITGNYIDGDVEFGEPIITDKISKQITKPRIRGFQRKMLPESNQDLTGKQNTFQLSQDIIDDIKKNLKNYSGNNHAQGVKRAENIVKNGRVSYDDGYRILNDIANDKSGEVLNTNGKLENEIRQKLNTGENISSNNRQSKMKRGENVIKSAPKTGMKGGAHSPKNNTIGVTYF